MSMLDLTQMQDEIEDSQEPTVADSGTEAKLRIVGVNSDYDKNDNEYFMPLFEVTDAPMVKEFSDFFHVPNRDKLTPKQYARSLNKIKNFTKAFGIDISRPIDYEDDLPGHTGWAILGARKDDEYGEQNTIRRYIVPK